MKADTQKQFPIRPIRGRVILKMDELGEVISDGGIITDLDSDQSHLRRDGTCRTGVVMAIDKDHKDSPDGVNVGDRVFFQVAWAGEGWEYKDVKYHTLEGEDVAVLVDHGVDLIGLTR